MIFYPSRPVRIRNLDFITRKNPEHWRLQFKFNGHHMVVSTFADGYMYSRHGSPLASAAKTDFSILCAKTFGPDCVLDGELMLPLKESGQPPWYVIWDIPVFQGRDLSQERYLTRLAILAKYWTDFRELGRIRLAHNLWIAELASLASLDGMLRACDGKVFEGVVAKNLAHHLNWSRIGQLECTNQLKFRVEDLRKPPPTPGLGA
jgi:hypothetical protein